MHAYGTLNGRITIKHGGQIALNLSIEDAQQLQRQLGVAIGEAERAIHGQLALPVPPVSSR